VDSKSFRHYAGSTRLVFCPVYFPALIRILNNSIFCHRRFWGIGGILVFLFLTVQTKNRSWLILNIIRFFGSGYRFGLIGYWKWLIKYQSTSNTKMRLKISLYKSKTAHLIAWQIYGDETKWTWICLVLLRFSLCNYFTTGIWASFPAHRFTRLSYILEIKKAAISGYF